MRRELNSHEEGSASDANVRGRVLRRAWALGTAGLIYAQVPLVASTAGCQPPTPRTVSMRMRGGVPKATVTIDEMYIGSLAMVKQRGVALPPGKHRITVEAPGYFPWDRLVHVQQADPPVFLDVRLRRIPE